MWVNDLDTGALWVTGTDGELDRIDDWGTDLADSDGEDDSEPRTATPSSGENPDADDAVFSEIRDQELDEDGINEPPVARDDHGPHPGRPAGRRRRAGATTRIPTATCCWSPALGQPAGRRASVTADRGPHAGAGHAAGRVHRAAWRSTTRSATVAAARRRRTSRSTCRAPTARQPAAGDRHRRRRGRGPARRHRSTCSTTTTTPTATRSCCRASSRRPARSSFDPTGAAHVHARSDEPAGTIELDVHRRRRFGATANGQVRVEIRLDGSNNEPDARNDSAVTVIGQAGHVQRARQRHRSRQRPADARRAAELVSPARHPNREPVQMSLSDDGEFFFVAADRRRRTCSSTPSSTAARATRRSSASTSSPATDNRPPVAVRDDVTIGRGGTRRPSTCCRTTPIRTAT